MSVGVIMETFVDGVLNVVLTKGVVRIDFFALSPTEVSALGEPCPVFRHRLILHPDQLPEVLGSLQVATDALRNRGLIGPPADAFPAAATVDIGGGPQTGPRSAPVRHDDVKPTWSANFPTTQQQGG